MVKYAVIHKVYNMRRWCLSGKCSYELSVLY